MGFIFRKRVVATALASVLLILPDFSRVYAAENDKYELYGGPNRDAEAVCEVEDHEKVSVLRRSGGAWYAVRLSDGTEGFLPSEDLLLLGDNKATMPYRAVTASAIQLKRGKAEGSARLAVLPANLPVRVLSENGTLLEIETDSGLRGFAERENFTSLSAESALVIKRPEVPAHGAKTEEEAAARLKELSEYFLDGYYWNHISDPNASNDEMLYRISSIPCTHEKNGYAYCNVYTAAPDALENKYGEQSQCMGYADFLSDLVFGSEAPVYEHQDLDKVRVGDHIRLWYYEHSFIVTEVGREADGTVFFRVTEVNADYENCEIDWDRTVTVPELRALGDLTYVYTRYPDSKSKKL